jgi:hypothetical protein
LKPHRQAQAIQAHRAILPLQQPRGARRAMSARSAVAFSV